DGAARLAVMIVDPARLAQRALTDEDACARLQEIALGPKDGEGRSVLAERWDHGQALQELAFLKPPKTDPPKFLPYCAGAVARRLQLRILQEELPWVARSVADDVAEGGQRIKHASDFLRGVDAVLRPSAADGTRLS